MHKYFSTTICGLITKETQENDMASRLDSRCDNSDCLPSRADAGGLTFLHHDGREFLQCPIADVWRNRPSDNSV